MTTIRTRYVWYIGKFLKLSRIFGIRFEHRAFIWRKISDEIPFLKPALLTISQDYIHIDNRTWVPHKASKKPKYVDKFWFNIASSYLLPHNCFRHSLLCNQGHVVKWNPNKYPLDPICDGIAADDKPSNCDMVCIEVSHTFYNGIALASSEKGLANNCLFE